MQASIPVQQQRWAAWQQACTHRRLIHVARAKSQGSRKPRGSDPLAGIEWWKDDSQPSTSASTSPETNMGQSARRQPQRGPAAADRGCGRKRGEGSSEGDEEEVGWWERPQPAPGSRQRPGAGRFQYDEEEEALSSWQEERLKVAYAVGRRKMKVQDLAADLGLDRSQVLAWMKAFGALSEAERTAALEPLGPAIAAAKQQTAAAAAAERRAAQEERQQAAAAALAAGALAPDAQAFTAPAADEAAAAARAAGAAQLAGVSRRLSGEALRSLAGVYRRSPWPPREVVAGLWELHRLPREAVQGWFKARRAADGLPDNPRDMKAGGGLSASVAAVSGDSPSWLDEESLGALISSARVRGQPAGAGPGAAKRAPPAELQQMLSGRELAALRSALPSPRTHKGARIRQELGIKDVEERATTTSSSSSNEEGRGPALSPSASGSAGPLQIAGITFVVRDSGAAWALKWRRWRLAQGTPAQRLDFQRWLMRAKQQSKQ